MAQITYTDKIALNVNSDIPAINKVNDTDMNEIKTVVNSNETKVVLAVTDTAPAQCSTGDQYYNTTTKLIYTATATDTWGSTGVTPTENTLYIEFSTQSTYAYNGTDLISVGGGTDFSSLIMVDPDVADQQTKLVIESTDLDGNYEVNTEKYSTEETLTNKIWIDGKPIYRKVVDFGTLPNATSKNVAHNISNLSNVVNIKGWTKRADGTTFPLPYESGSQINESMALFSNNTNISIYCGVNRTEFTTTYIILEYTKSS